MAYLDWISDIVLESAVQDLLGKASAAKRDAKKHFNKNVIDPFAAFFEISGFEIDYEHWETSEQNRQSQKTLQNHIGDFHQKILGSCKEFKNMGIGSEIDVVSVERKIIAEIKNKYNTLSGGQLANLYKTLDNLVMSKSSVYKDYTAYYVTILPKKPIRYNKVFTPSDRAKGQKCTANSLIKEIDGASFYELVTGSKSALINLFECLPTVVGKQIGRSPSPNDFLSLKNIFLTAYSK
jgi:hypothetical protein